MDTDYQTEPMDDLDYHGQTHKPHFEQSGKKKKSGKKKWIIVVIIAVVLIGGGGTGAYLSIHKSNQTKAKAAAAKKASETPKLLSGEQAQGSNYFYKDAALSMGITFPKSWTLKLSSDQQEMIITSPETTYMKKNGSVTNGVFTIKLRNGLIPSAIQSTVEASVAVDNSQVVAYSNPTTNQRQYTNLSFAGPDANDFSYMIVTGDTSFTAGQAFGGGVDLDGQSYLIAGGYGTDSGDSLSFDSVPKADYNSSVLQQAETIIESLELY